ncbi:serine/threonine-protein kinase STY13-like [Arachis duranensis]|uniref:Serine/threonine-protein kinase STY13-like n=1 Tax=Arachis duranensis TaxID=130453 RepID=A0A6P4E0W4_ARADU|nr:serine/threonine-protein kinase STY13-like [Arachis duranensis]
MMMMSLKKSPQIDEKEKGALSPRESPVSSSSKASSCNNKNNNKKKYVEPPSPALPSGCCRGFTNNNNNNVKIKNNATSTTNNGSIASTSQQNHQTLESKVADLEKEVQKQAELRVMYRKRMERTQDYLRYCLQIAQENGILDLIVQQPPLSHALSSSSIIASPQVQIPTSTTTTHLARIIDQAKINGWYIDPIEIHLQEKIGEGSTADIYKGRWRGFQVAVKCISPEFFHTNQNGVVFFVQELETLSKQRHRFVLQLMGACLDPPQQAWIVTEYLTTNLKEYLHGPGNTRSKERVVPLSPFRERIVMALEIAQAMQYLHRQNPKIIHRDLKPSNIFLDDALHVRVADFGHARFLGDQEMALTGETGTYVYMAPEVIRCEPYNEKCDVYSFGIILNELLTGNHPYIETEYGPTKIAMGVVEGKLRPMLPCDDDSNLMEDLIDLINLCWHANPSTRPSFEAITRTLEIYVKKLYQTISTP